MDAMPENVYDVASQNDETMLAAIQRLREEVEKATATGVPASTLELAVLQFAEQQSQILRRLEAMERKASGSQIWAGHR